MSKIKNYCVTAPIATSFLTSNFNSIRAILIAALVVLFLLIIALSVGAPKKSQIYSKLKLILFVVLLINIVLLAAYQLNFYSKYNDYQLKSMRNQMMDNSYATKDCI